VRLLREFNRVASESRQFLELLRFSRDPGSQQVRDQVQVTELQKKHRSIKRLGNGSFGGELFVQKLRKSPLATGRNS
jgi:hypothetical protein